MVDYWSDAFPMGHDREPLPVDPPSEQVPKPVPAPGAINMAATQG
jgi:hypothetical protein